MRNKRLHLVNTRFPKSYCKQVVACQAALVPLAAHLLVLSHPCGLGIQSSAKSRGGSDEAPTSTSSGWESEPFFEMRCQDACKRFHSFWSGGSGLQSHVLGPCSLGSTQQSTVGRYRSADQIRAPGSPLVSLWKLRPKSRPPGENPLV